MKRKILFTISLILLLFVSCESMQQVDKHIIDRQVDLRKTEWIYYK